jgi:hypothetical protein
MNWNWLKLTETVFEFLLYSIYLPIFISILLLPIFCNLGNWNEFNHNTK